MTCWSCEHYRLHGCHLGREGWPDIGEACPAFSYEPGSDEQERPAKPSGFRVVAPHFVAGGEACDGVAVRVAPIIRYMLGWTGKQVRDYCRRKGWTVAANG